MAGNKIILTCGHCGNKTAFAVAAERFRPDTFDANDAETTTWRTWRVLLCSTCSQPTLKQDVQTVSGGHMGAHLTDEEILPEDVPVIIDFVEAILEYLYVAPAKIRAVQERLGRVNTTQ